MLLMEIVRLRVPFSVFVVVSSGVTCLRTSERSAASEKMWKRVQNAVGVVLARMAWRLTVSKRAWSLMDRV